MSKKSTFKHKLLPLGVAGAMLICTPGLAMAAVDAYVTQGKDMTSTYSYQLTDLKASLQSNLINPTLPGAGLWKHFMENKESILSLHDDKNGYISFKDVKDALADSLVNGTPFSVNTYTESDEAELSTGLPETISGITMVGGEVKKIDITTVTVTTISAITLTTVAGTAPVLPAEVSATMSNGTTEKVAVTWGTVTETQYAAPGTFEVIGTVANTTKTVKATITVKAAEEVLVVDSVSAINGTITVTFSNIIGDIPIVGDFKVTQAVDGGEASDVTESVTDLDVAGNTVILTLPEVVATAEERSVVYSVSYKGSSEKEYTVIVAKTVDPQGEIVAAAAVADLKTKAEADLTVEVNLKAAEAAVIAANLALEGVNAGDAKDALIEAVTAAATKVTDARTVFNTTAAATAIAAINGATAETIQSVLETNAQALTLDLTGYNALDTTYKTAVATTVLNGKSIQPDGKYAEVSVIKTAFDNSVLVQVELQAKVVVTTAVNAVVVDVEAEDQEVAEAIAEMKALLNAEALGLDLTDYNTLVDFSKNIVVTALIEHADFAEAGAVKTEFDIQVGTQVAALETALADVNGAAIDGMKTVLEAKANVLGLNIGEESDYAVIGASFQAAAANAVVTARPLNDPATTDIDEAGYANHAAVKTAFDTAVAAQKVEAIKAAVTAVNNSTTAGGTKTVLENGAVLLGLELTKYAALGDESIYQTAVAQAVLNGKGIQPSAKYQTAEAIKVAFNAAVVAQEMAAVNAVVIAVNAVPAPVAGDATDAEATAMQTVLVDNAATLGIVVTGEESIYAILTEAGQLAVAEVVLEGRPQTGFTSIASIKEAFDTAVTAQKATESAADLQTAMDAVNVAANTDAMIEAIALPALELSVDELSAYEALSNAGKLYVGQKLIDDRALQVDQQYANKAAVKAVFDAAVQYRTSVEAGQSVTTAIAAVNAADAEGIEAVLESNAIALTLAIGTEENPTDYSKLRETFQDEVAAAVLAAKPVGGYITKAQIVTAFNAAVVEQTASQATEDAAIDAINDVEAAVQDATPAQLAVARDAMLQALLANVEVLQLGNEAAVAPATALDDYNALSLAAKRDVAAAMFIARDDEFAYVGGIIAIEAAFDDAVTAQVAEQAGAVDAINGAITASALVTALTDNADSLSLDMTVFGELENSSKLQVAQVVLDGKLSQVDQEYGNASAIKTVFNSAMASVLADDEAVAAVINAVNSASESTMLAVLTTNAANLDLNLEAESDFADLGESYKQAVAKAVVTVRPIDDPETADVNEAGYATLGAIKAAFDNGVEAQVVMTAVDAVNNAVTVTATQTALVTNAVILNLGLANGYNDLTADQQLTVATKVKNAKAIQPNGRFANATTLKTVFDGAVAEFTAPTLTNSVWVDQPVAAEDAVAASGLIDFTLVNTAAADGVEASTVVVEGNTLVFGINYNTASDLATAINDLAAGVAAVVSEDDGDVIIITADVAGEVGNEIELQGSTLTNGADAVVEVDGVFTLTFNEPVVVVDGTLVISFESGNQSGTVISANAVGTVLTVTVDGDTSAMSNTETITGINITDALGVEVDLDAAIDKIIDVEVE